MSKHFILAIAIATFTSSVLLSADWTTFRGKDGNGKSPDTGLLEKWSEHGPELLWSIDTIGMGYSSISIAGDRIYANGNVGDLSMVFCFDKNGKEIWKENNGPAHANARSYPGTRSTPTIDGDFVFDMSPLGEIACFDAKTGKKIWNRNILNDYDVPPIRWFFGHSVVVDGDNVISLLGGKHSAVALDKRTGKPVWTAASVNAASSYTTPYFFEFEGIRVVVVMSDSTVEGLDPKTGKTLFSTRWTNSRNVHCTMPIYHEGHLFMTTGYEGGASKLFKLAKNADGTLKLDELWSEPRFNNHHGGVVLSGGHVYGTNHD
ncbi:MAG: PQQ-binding-like beta-propeller repeat protein, partial [Bacteroidales bacterium]|nr:PQQ-binding-like beta-propeller repeat protein [Bacteroidales bacterium]